MLFHSTEDKAKPLSGDLQIPLHSGSHPPLQATSQATPSPLVHPCPPFSFLQMSGMFCCPMDGRVLFSLTVREPSSSDRNGHATSMILILRELDRCRQTAHNLNHFLLSHLNP